MKHLVFSLILLLILSSCGYRPIYQEYRTYEPTHIIDSIAASNKYLDADTTYWQKQVYLNYADTTLIKSWYQSWDQKKMIGSMTLIQYQSGEYILKYKVE